MTRGTRSVRIRFAIAVATTLIGVTGAASGGVLRVLSVQPTADSMHASIDTSISVEFDQAVDPATITDASFWAYGRWSGPASGTFSFSPDGRTVTLHPDGPLSAGETVTLILSHDIQAPGGSPLRSAGYSYQFWTRALPATMDFFQIASMTTRTIPSQSSRAYGGVASDLDNDGFMDITTVNEDTADLRVFMNKADGTGLFDPFTQPTFPVGPRASPSEPADFDRDGNTDICVANINADTVSILLGNGDGTYAPQQLIPVGDAPRGIAVLDVDGDGDLDVVNTNANSSNLSLLLNDGNGVFGAATFFGGGGVGEWALAAADMDNDGILDLVVGARTSQTVIVNHGNGDGTFTAGTPFPSGGSTWMLVCGDVDGDGNNDVAAVNSSQNRGSILLGNGMGGFAAPQNHMTDSFPLATDLADLDGDGDLDWITSSFGGDWSLFTNDGSGTFTFDREFPSPTAASCSLPFDFDNDGDLDIALIDELADVVILMVNSSIPCIADIDGSGSVGFADLTAVLAAWGPCPGCPEDINADGVVGFVDLLELLANWGPCT